MSWRRSPLRPHQKAQAPRRVPRVLRSIRSLYPLDVRRHFVLDNFSPHKGEKVREWAARHNVELDYTPFYASWLNRIEAQFRALRYFTFAGTET